MEGTIPNTGASLLSPICLIWRREDRVGGRSSRRLPVAVAVTIEPATFASADDDGRGILLMSRTEPPPAVWNPEQTSISAL